MQVHLLIACAMLVLRYTFTDLLYRVFIDQFCVIKSVSVWEASMDVHDLINIISLKTSWSN